MHLSEQGIEVPLQGRRRAKSYPVERASSHLPPLELSVEDRETVPAGDKPVNLSVTRAALVAIQGASHW